MAHAHDGLCRPIDDERIPWLHRDHHVGWNLLKHRHNPSVMVLSLTFMDTDRIAGWIKDSLLIRLDGI